MIKYLGSKRRLVPVLGAIATVAGARRALDLFTGTTRVAQELKRRGAHVTAVDSARYAEVFAQCYVALDGAEVDSAAIEEALGDLMGRPAVDGYFTETFCVRSRFVQPDNGRRIDAIRAAIDGYELSPVERGIVLTSLLEAARAGMAAGIANALVPGAGILDPVMAARLLDRIEVTVL